VSREQRIPQQRTTLEPERIFAFSSGMELRRHKRNDSVAKDVESGLLCNHRLVFIRLRLAATVLQIVLEILRAARKQR
jgi:hypothetical protein